MERAKFFSIAMAFALLTGVGLAGQAQESPQGGAEQPKAAAHEPSSPAGQSPSRQAEAAIKSGTKIEAELESTLDARTVKPGDEVTARVTKDVKQEGRKVISKGDRLVGRITEVKANGDAGAKGEAGSQLAVTFDRLVQGETKSQLNTVVTSVLSVPAENRGSQNRTMQSEPVMMPAAAPVARPAPSGGGGGGLLGGVGSTVGSTVGATGSTLGGVAGGASSTLSSTTNATGQVAGGTAGSLNATSQSALGGAAHAGLATPRKAIQLDSQSNAQAENQTAASSVFSTRNGDLRMDSGTKLEFQTQAHAKAEGNVQ